MCTIVAFHGPRLVIAANRDELYARTADPPAWRRAGDLRAIYGVDREAGGTWAGANERGLFVALTNQRTYQAADRMKRSRGQVVIDMLACPTPELAEAMLRARDPADTNAFNVLFGAPGDVRVAYSRPDASLEVERLAPGLVVLPNDRLGSPDFPKISRAEGLARSIERTDVDALRALLADHHKPDMSAIPVPPPGTMLPHAFFRELQALCIHTPLYGTVSSTVLVYGEDGRLERYLYADGPPCTHPLVEI